jgi:hypothetical protein
MRELNYGEAELLHAYSNTKPHAAGSQNLVIPFFSMRKLRLVFNELSGNIDFEFANFDAFRQHVLSSAAPQLELNKWQAIAARR